MKRKLIFKKEIDEMLNTPDDLHKLVNGKVVAIDLSESARQLGKIGGASTLKKYGKDRMIEWGKKGGRPRKLTK